MKREIFRDNITVYRDDNDNVVLAVQDIPVRAGDEGDDHDPDDYDDPDEIIAVRTVAVDPDTLRELLADD